MDGKVSTTFIIIICLILLSSTVNHAQEMEKDIFVFGETDFKDIVHTSTFVDKTLMIMDVFKKRSEMILITAPRCFGKSTNMNMIKRFLEIEVDPEGKPKDLMTLENYRLFMDNDLAIARHSEFFNKHFGKHPVMCIDYNPLRKVRRFDDVLTVFKEIVARTFSSHADTINVTNFWHGELSVANFIQYVDNVVMQQTNVDEFVCGFRNLSELLYAHFEKKVIVLIDEYDAYIDGQMFVNNPDMERIVSFIRSVHKNLFGSNAHLGRAILTGTFRPTGKRLATLPPRVMNYNFLEDHVFCKYYGLTSDELDEVLLRHIPNETARIQTRRTIDDYYNGYLIRNQNTHIFSLWSVLQYLRQGRLKSYWNPPVFFKDLKMLFMIPEIAVVVQDLLVGEPIPFRPLRETDILELNSVLRTGSIVDENFTADALLELLYSSGCLTPSQYEPDVKELVVNVPNEEIVYALASVFLKIYEGVYSFSSRHIKSLHSAIDSFRPDTDNRKTFKKLVKTVTSMFNESSFNISKEEDVQFAFLVAVATKPEYSPTSVERDKKRNCFTIVVINKHNLAVFLELKTVGTLSQWVRERSAQIAFEEIETDIRHAFSEIQLAALRGTVRIGISLDAFKRASIAYSYHYGIGFEGKSLTTNFEVMS